MSSRNRHTLKPLTMAVLALSVATPVAAQEAPGWLNWGGDASKEAADGQDGRGAAQPTAERVRAVDTQSESGQAVLLQRLMQRVNDLERQAQEMRGRLSEQERALERQQKRHEQALLEMEAQLSTAAAVGRTPQESRAPDDDVGAEPAQATNTQDEQAKDEQATDGADSAQAPAQTEGASERVSDEEQQALYNQAFEVLKSGKYEQAVSAFQKVIDANPEGNWTPSALFWQGETYYVQQDYPAARKAYAEMLQRFPESNRVPDAKLKLGYVAQERDDIEAARALFNEILSDYPDSQAAGLAKNRLNRLERSGG